MSNFRTYLSSTARRSREQAFTLVELLIVVGIVLVLAAIAIPVYLGIQQQAKNNALKADVQNVVKQTLIVAQQASGQNNADGYVAYRRGSDNPATTRQVGVPYTVASEKTRIMITSPVPEGTNPVSGSVNGQFVQQTHGSPSGYQVTGYWTDNSFYFTYNSDTGKFTTGDNPYYTQYAPSWSGSSITTRLPNAIVNQAYSFTFTTTASPDATYTANNLPAGLSLSSDGKLTGTPTTGGDQDVNVTATNPSGSITGAYKLLVQVPPQISTTSLPPGDKDTQYNATVSATGIAAPTFAATGLPTGLSINTTTGAIFGTPSVRGTFTVSVTATNGAGSVSQAYALTIKDKPTIDPSNNLGTITVNQQYSYIVTTTGEPAPTFTATGLPTGLAINAATGEINGKIDPSDPTYGAGGTYSITVTATNPSGNSSQTFTGNIYAAPSIKTTSLPAASVTSAYTQSITVTGNPTATVSLLSGSLPAGLTLGSNGAFSGTPTATGTYSFTVKATNTVGNDTAAYALVVKQPAGIATANGSLPEALKGSPYSATIQTTGYPAPTVSMSSTTTGITFNPTNNTLGGTPTVSGQYNLTFTATNADGSSSKTLILTINSGAALTTASLDSGVQNQAYSKQVNANGYPAPTFSATGLPSGLSISSSGLISGTPTVGAGTYTVNVVANNAFGSDNRNYALVINTVPVITTTGTLPTAAVGGAYSAQISATGTPAPTFSATGLPSGLSINSSTGVISGTPGASGNFTVTVTATNTAGSDVEPFSLPVATNWVQCATENDFCNFPSGTTTVRYGVSGSYYYKTITDGTACNNATFGDPASGSTKYCWFASNTNYTYAPFTNGNAENTSNPSGTWATYWTPASAQFVTDTHAVGTTAWRVITSGNQYDGIIAGNGGYAVPANTRVTIIGWVKGTAGTAWAVGGRRSGDEGMGGYRLVTDGTWQRVQVSWTVSSATTGAMIQARLADGPFANKTLYMDDITMYLG